MNNRTGNKKRILYVWVLLISIIVLSAICLITKEKNKWPDIVKVGTDIEVEENEILFSEKQEDGSVRVSKVNYIYKSESDGVRISEYNGEEECIIIPTQINGKKVEKVEKDAFEECYNLETIKVPVELKDIVTEIKDFEVNEENSNDEYIEFNTTKEYSDIYKAYMELTEEEKERTIITPYKFAVSSEEEISQASDETSKYDLRDYIEIEVENQGNHGTCYAYSALTAVETWIAKNKGELVDLSDVHAAVYSSGSGGEFNDLEDYFKSNNGPIWEVDCDREHFGNKLSTSDYNIINGYLISASGYTDAQIAHMKSVLPGKRVIGNIESTRKLFPSNDTIKENIKKYGAVVSYYYNDSAYMKNYNGYTVYNYEGGLTNFPDHAVCIIGWDDNFSRYNFPESIRPSSNGAFLVLNSWGENWGTDGGCFWVSYSDTWLGWHAIDVVTSVSDLSGTIKLNKTVIKDLETGENIEKINNMNNLVKRGTHIEMNLDLRYVSSNILVNPSDLTVTVRNPIEGVSTNLTVSSKDGYITIPIDTKNFKVGSHYIIDIKYGSETISKSIKIVENLYNYEIKADNTIKLTGYNGNEENIVIPQEYVGLKVTEIGTKAFYNNKGIKTIKIYKNVEKIGNNAFYGSGLTIYGHAGSIAETYSKNNSISFEYINPTNIEIKENPSKVRYVKGEELDLTGGKILATYEDEKIEEILMTDENVIVAGYDKTIVGEQEITVTYKEKTAIFKVKTTNNITDIQILANPSKTEYIRGENLDLTGGKITVIYEDTSTEEILMTDKQITVTGYDKTIVGEQEVLITYEEKVAKIKIKVRNNITRIQVIKEPNKIFYIKEEDLDLTGGELAVVYEDGTIQKVLFTDEEVTATGYDKTKIGEQEVIITYAEKTAVFKVKVTTNSIVGIKIQELPTKIDYIKEEELDLTGGKILVTYEDGMIQEILMTDKLVTVIGYDKTKLGEQEVTVAYAEKTVVFNVKVTNDIVGIKIQKLPSKVEYIVNEDLNLENGKILVLYEDKTTQEILMTNKNIKVTGYDKTKLGEQEVTVVYAEKTAVFNVKVTNNIVGIKIQNLPSKVEYIVGEELNLEGGKIIVIYQDKTTQEILMTDKNIKVTGYDKTNLGEQSLELEYLGYKTTLKITVKVKQNENNPEKEEVIKAELKLTGDNQIQSGNKTTLNLSFKAEGAAVGIINGKIKYSDNVSSLQIKGKNGWQVAYNKETEQFYVIKQAGAGNEYVAEISCTIIGNNDEKAIITLEDIKFTSLNGKVVNGTNISKEIKIEVTPKTLESIEVTRNPNKKTYTEGEEFSSKGWVVTAKYSDGSKKNVTDKVLYTPLGALDKDDDRIIISYLEGDVAQTTHYDINVEEKKNSNDDNSNVNNKDNDKNDNVVQPEIKDENEDVKKNFLTKNNLINYLIIAIILLMLIITLYIIKHKKNK